MPGKYLQSTPQAGSTDTVPAMLTPGEFVIRKEAADEIGRDKLHAMNNVDRLSGMAAVTNYKPAKFQEGGDVSGRKKAHLALAGMGMIPGVGNVADITDAALYGLEGDKLNALMSLGAAVPVLGLAAGARRLGKAAKKLKYDPNVAPSVPTPRTKTGQFFKDPFRGVSKKRLLKEVENSGLPDAYGEPLSYFKKLDADELAEILRGYHGPDLKYVKDVGYQEGGDVMNYFGGGMVRNAGAGYQEGGAIDTLRVFGDKSRSADDLSAMAAMEMLKAQSPPSFQYGGPVPPMQQQGMMSQQALPPAGFMQQGGVVRQPMPTGEPAGMQERPVPQGERAYSQKPQNQLNPPMGLDPYQFTAYEKYGPAGWREKVTTVKPKSEWTPYDAMVDAGIVNPNEEEEDDFKVRMAREAANGLRLA